MLLPISLTAAGALVLLHVWLSARIIQVRVKAKVLFGDGGSDPLLRRMRAHLNFAENTPLFLILLILLELAGTWNLVLWIGTIIFVLARICHAFGMDRDGPNPFRMAGTIGSITVLLVFAGWAISLTYAATAPAPASQQAPLIKG